MNAFLTIILAVQMLTALVMIGLILVQHGKGADMGAAFGSGGSGSLFGASGSSNFMSRATGVLAAVFFVSTLALAYFSNLRPTSSGSVLEGITVPAPAQGASAPAGTVAPAASAPLGASDASQIPGSTAPAGAKGTTGAAPAPAAAAPATPASGAAQIPTR